MSSSQTETNLGSGGYGLGDVEEDYEATRTRSLLVRCGDRWAEWATLKPRQRTKVRPGVQGCMREYQHEQNPNCMEHTKAAKGWTHTEVIDEPISHADVRSTVHRK